MRRKTHVTPITEWPSAKRLKALLNRKRGHTAYWLGEKLELEPHSVRSLISRLRAEGLVIIKERDGKVCLYRLGSRRKGGAK